MNVARGITWRGKAGQTKVGAGGTDKGSGEGDRIIPQCNDTKYENTVLAAFTLYGNLKIHLIFFRREI